MHARVVSAEAPAEKLQCAEGPHEHRRAHVHSHEHAALEAAVASTSMLLAALHASSADAAMRLLSAHNGPLSDETREAILTRDARHGFAFASIKRPAFDRAGVLYALGTRFGSCEYSNPAASGAVAVDFSDDANNYYSKRTSHKMGWSKEAAALICSTEHPGDGATMFSAGNDPRAFFGVHLVGFRLQPTHLCYRGDYGGGGNHPRHFELLGSNDGEEWTTLRSFRRARARQDASRASPSVPAFILI